MELKNLKKYIVTENFKGKTKSWEIGDIIQIDVCKVTKDSIYGLVLHTGMWGSISKELVKEV